MFCFYCTDKSVYSFGNNKESLKEWDKESDFKICTLKLLLEVLHKPEAGRSRKGERRNELQIQEQDLKPMTGAAMLSIISVREWYCIFWVAIVKVLMLYVSRLETGQLPKLVFLQDYIPQDTNEVLP